MDPWHIGPRLRYWRTKRGLSTRVFADLIARSPSWVQMVERGRRSAYDILDLANIAVALQLDLGVFLTSPVPGVPDADQQAMLSLLKRAFDGRDPKDGLADLARIADAADAEDDLMLIVEPGGRLRLVNRREALKTGGVVGISLAGSLGWLYQEEARAAMAGTGTISRTGAGSLRAIVTAYRSLDDEIGPAPLRAGVASHLQVVEGLRGAGKTEEVEHDLGRIAGELEQLSGWLAQNSGDRRAARTYYRKALGTARRLRDNALAAYTLGWMSVLEGDLRRPTDAVTYAAAGVEEARRSGSRRLTAALLARSAQANGQAGDSDAARARIDAAREELALAEDGKSEDPPFIYWFDSGSLDAQAGKAFVFLGAPPKAEPLLRTRVASLAGRPDLVSFHATANGDLALCLAQADEIPEAACIGIEVDRLRQQRPSEWHRRQLLQLRGMLRDSRDPAAVELRERLVAA
jgi:transcriptional regulator with XRE-family HTH domain